MILQSDILYFLAISRWVVSAAISLTKSQRSEKAFRSEAVKRLLIEFNTIRNPQAKPVVR